MRDPRAKISQGSLVSFADPVMVGGLKRVPCIPAYSRRGNVTTVASLGNVAGVACFVCGSRDGEKTKKDLSYSCSQPTDKCRNDRVFRLWSVLEVPIPGKRIFRFRKLNLKNEKEKKNFKNSWFSFFFLFDATFHPYTNFLFDVRIVVILTISIFYIKY